jgi:hypothetical protein
VEAEAVAVLGVVGLGVLAGSMLCSEIWDGMDDDVVFACIPRLSFLLSVSRDYICGYSI